jgi:hypothetical protein
LSVIGGRKALEIEITRRFVIGIPPPSKIIGPHRRAAQGKGGLIGGKHCGHGRLAIGGRQMRQRDPAQFVETGAKARHRLARIGQIDRGVGAEQAGPADLAQGRDGLLLPWGVGLCRKPQGAGQGGRFGRAGGDRRDSPAPIRPSAARRETERSVIIGHLDQNAAIAGQRGRAIVGDGQNYVGSARRRTFQLRQVQPAFGAACGNFDRGARVAVGDFKGGVGAFAVKSGLVIGKPAIGQLVAIGITAGRGVQRQALSGLGLDGDGCQSGLSIDDGLGA